MPTLSTPPQDQLRLVRDRATGLEAVEARFHGHAYDMHTHDDDWLVGVTHHGVQDFYCQGQRRQSTRGQIILIEPGERHDGQAPRDHSFAYAMLYLPRDWLHGSFGGDGALGFRETLTSDPRLAQAIRHTCGALFDAAPRMMIEARRDALLGHLRRHLGAHPAPLPRPDAAMAQRAMSYLQAHFEQEIGLEDLARISGAQSRFQLSRAFQQHFRVAPHACLVQLRLSRARSLLRDGMAAAEVAAACGFADQSHLGRWFRRAYGLSPAAYAKAGAAHGCSRPAPRPCANDRVSSVESASKCSKPRPPS